MGIFIVLLITLIIGWKNIYSLVVIYQALKEHDSNGAVKNIIFCLGYMLYYYIIYSLMSDKMDIFAPDKIIVVIIGITLGLWSISSEIKLLLK